MSMRVYRDSIWQRCVAATRSHISRRVGQGSMSNTGSRREFLARATAGGVCLLTFSIAGCERKLTPAQAHEMKVPFRTLAPADVKTVEALGEVLLPGSAAAGLAHYLDHQLSADPADSMLMIKYL